MHSIMTPASKQTKCPIKSARVRGNKEAEKRRAAFFMNCFRRRFPGVQIVPEYQFHPKRRWRFDFAIPEQKIALECEGGLFSGHGHNRGAAMIRDMEKYNAAAILGWRLLRTIPRDIDSGKVFDLFVDIDFAV